MAGIERFINPRRVLFAISHLLPRIGAFVDRIEGATSEAMVTEMRADVPVDSGRLLNGIRAYREGDETVVEASAVRDGFDYAFVVERGRVADAGFFAAEPFFYPAVEEVLAKRGRDMADVIDDAAALEGLK